MYSKKENWNGPYVANNNSSSTEQRWFCVFATIGEGKRLEEENMDEWEFEKERFQTGKE